MCHRFHDRYEIRRPRNISQYKLGLKYCTLCGYYTNNIIIPKINCPCCGSKFRLKGRKGSKNIEQVLKGEEKNKTNGRRPKKEIKTGSTSVTERRSNIRKTTGN